MKHFTVWLFTSTFVGIGASVLTTRPSSWVAIVYAAAQFFVSYVLARQHFAVRKP